MKSLLLLRHAKSSHADSTMRDIERQLNGRGREAAPRVGRAIRERGLRPGVVLCSTAVRTRQTAELLLQAAKLDVPVLFDERIYEASLGRLLEVVADVDDKYEAALLVGHNPGLEELLEHLTGSVEMMPTAALAHLTLAIDEWMEISNLCGTLDWLLKPRDLT